jgi:hypothetical protein
MSEVAMKKLFQIASIAVIVAGVIMAFLGSTLNDEWEGMYSITGPIILILGILLLLTGFFSKGAAESSQARILSIILLLGSILGIIGVFGGDLGGMISLGGVVFLFITFLSWPCLCFQSQKGISSQVIGVACAHDSISINEISRITGHNEQIVREVIYDAIGKGKMSGKMEGDTFIRLSPAPSTSGTTTHEREVVKVLVICPYCGAKTEQGVSKCQNCQADL